TLGLDRTEFYQGDALADQFGGRPVGEEVSEAVDREDHPAFRAGEGQRSIDGREELSRVVLGDPPSNPSPRIAGLLDFNRFGPIFAPDGTGDHPAGQLPQAPTETVHVAP